MEFDPKRWRYYIPSYETVSNGFTSETQNLKPTEIWTTAGTVEIFYLPSSQLTATRAAYSCVRCRYYGGIQHTHRRVRVCNGPSSC